MTTAHTATPTVEVPLHTYDEMRRKELAHGDLVRLAERVANLNEHAGEIGAGMLVQLVTEARAVLAKAGAA